jgi:hypothetical protein
MYGAPLDHWCEGFRVINALDLSAAVHTDMCFVFLEGSIRTSFTSVSPYEVEISRSRW